MRLRVSPTIAALRRIPAACRIPYSQGHAVEFVRGIADSRETAFLIEKDHTPIGMVGVDWREPEMPELGYWLGVEYWGQGLATEAARAMHRFHLRAIRHRPHALRRARRQPRFTQRAGEMRLPVERRRAASLRIAGIIDSGRLLPPDAQHLGFAEELEQFDAARNESPLRGRIDDGLHSARVRARAGKYKAPRR